VDWTPSFPGGVDAFRLFVEHLDGQDPHDWIFELARGFGDLKQVVQDLVRLLAMR
jgi:hypothetical protein